MSGWQFYEKIESFMGNMTEGWKGYALIGGVGVLLLIVVVMLVIISFNKETPDMMTDRGIFSDNAKSYCLSIGYNSMKWINDSNPDNFNYTCVNSEKANTSIENFYVK
jgi:hypothetical protein